MFWLLLLYMNSIFSFYQGGDVKMPPSGPAGFTAPPPPPPPPPPMDDEPSDNDQSEINRDALFKELRKGTEITKGNYIFIHATIIR